MIVGEILKAMDDAIPKTAKEIHLSPDASTQVIEDDELVPFIPYEEGEIKIRGARMVTVPEVDVPKCGFKLIF